MDAVQALGTVASDIDTVAGALQRAGSEGTDGLVVLNDQKFCHGGDICRDWLTIPERRKICDRLRLRP